MVDFIPVNEPLIVGNEKKYVNQCLDTGWISSEGSFVKAFEEQFAKSVDRKYGISVCNGTAALQIAIEALNIQNDDEVIMPTLTIISCVSAVIRVGAVPVLIDCDPLTFNMQAEDVEAKITSKTKAIMVVHIYGLPVNMDPILRIAKKYKLKIIEDAAEVIGQMYKGMPCGSFGDISVFSFYANKHITTGEGGMVVVDSKKLADRCQSLRNLCFTPERRFLHRELGWNYRLTNLQAAIGLAQLEQLPKTVLKKRAIGRLYDTLLKDIPAITLPQPKTDYAENIYWVYPLVIKKEHPATAVQIMEKLQKLGVGTRPFFYPLHLQPVLLDLGLFRNEIYANAEYLEKKGFYIPSGLAITVQQIRRVAKAIKQVFSS